MPSQKQLEKSAWEWAETTKPADITENNLETAYRINFDRCQEKVCRVNCIGNPWCLSHLTKRRWLDENLDIGELIPEVEIQMRDQDAFIGLRNLGATCYLNAYLQLWYHNVSIRRAILLWQDEPNSNGAAEPTETEGESAKVWLPNNLCGHLQLIFAGLSFSYRRSVDTKPLVEFLNLDASLQQDSNEFSLLFMARLEDFLSRHPDKSVHRAIEQQFRGQQCYTTTCNTCRNQSKRVDNFLELVLISEKQKQLEHCLDDYLKAEELTQDNQYQCQVCGTKQDATRNTELVSFPPVLNLQLSRFKFDRESGKRKKLGNTLEFPDVLDMTKYVNSATNAGEDFRYKLCSILYHQGTSATKGHYIATVLDPSTHVWNKFNDDCVTKVGSDVGHTLIDSDEEQKPLPKKPKTVNELYKSKDVYMLAYRRYSADEAAVEPVTLQMLPARVQKVIESDNTIFEQELDRQKQKAGVTAFLVIQRQSTVKEIWSMIQSDNDMDQIEFISSEWLMHFLDVASDCEVKFINNRCLLCPHNKMSPDKVSQAKIISSRAATALFAKFGGDIRLPSKQSICKQCVADKCRVIFAKKELQEDYSAMMPVSKLTKSIENIAISDLFWVGKESLSRWKQRAYKLIEQHGLKTDEDPATDDSSNGDVSTSTSNADVSMDVYDNNVGFNSEIICDHGKLSVDSGNRRLVNEDAWTLLKKYFPEALEFVGDSEVCSICQDVADVFAGELEDRKKYSQELKTALPHLYGNKRRPTVVTQTDDTLYLVAKETLRAFRAFIKDPRKYDPPSSIKNAELLCPHGGLLYNIDPESDVEEDRFSLVTANEWTNLTKFFKVDSTITVKSTVDDENKINCVYKPATCQGCLNKRVTDEYVRQFVYQSAKINIRKISDEQKSARKSKKHAMNDAEGDKPETKTAGQNGIRESMGQSESSRQSARLRKGQDVEVSSSLTIGDLKMKLVTMYSGGKSDMHLYVDNEELTNDNATLESLKILPGTTLNLKVDPKILEEGMVIDDDSGAGDQQFEQGFLGTGLLA